MEINIGEIRQLREEVENIRRSVARLEGRLDVIELTAKNIPILVRFKTTDPVQEDLGFSLTYKCAHQVEYIVTSSSMKYLSPAFFITPCDCDLEK